MGSLSSSRTRSVSSKTERQIWSPRTWRGGLVGKALNDVSNALGDDGRPLAGSDEWTTKSHLLKSCGNLPTVKVGIEIEFHTCTHSRTLGSGLCLGLETAKPARSQLRCVEPVSEHASPE